MMTFARPCGDCGADTSSTSPLLLPLPLCDACRRRRRRRLIAFAAAIAAVVLAGVAIAEVLL